jgi:hypothetical protein
MYVLPWFQESTPALALAAIPAVTVSLIIPMSLLLNSMRGPIGTVKVGGVEALSSQRTLGRADAEAPAKAGWTDFVKTLRRGPESPLPDVSQTSTAYVADAADEPKVSGLNSESACR